MVIYIKNLNKCKFLVQKKEPPGDSGSLMYYRLGSLFRGGDKVPNL